MKQLVKKIFFAKENSRGTQTLATQKTEQCTVRENLVLKNVNLHLL